MRQRQPFGRANARVRSTLVAAISDEAEVLIADGTDSFKKARHRLVSEGGTPAPLGSPKPVRSGCSWPTAPGAGQC